MNKFKRVLAFLLSFIMIVSSVDLTSVLTVNAAEDTETTTAIQREENEIVLTEEQIGGKSASGHGAELAIDGDLTTYYQTPETSSNFDYMRYVDIDLQGLYEITEVILYNIEGSYNHYQIYASETGESYDKIAYKNSDDMPDVENGEPYTFETPVKASKIRINLSYNSNGMQGNLAEVRLFGEKVGETEDSGTKEITVTNFEDTEWKTEWDKFESDADYAHDKTVQEMSNLVGRVIGEEWKDDFVFEIKEFPSENDTYEIENGEDGRIIIRGNNGIAMASGFNHYLKYYCKVDYNPLFVSNLNMPDTLPEIEEKIVKETQYDIRYAFNFCTYSYTMSFWDWDEYEEFLDWAAMSGINLVLDIVGQEEIVRRVLLEYGYTNEEIKEYISGPAYFAWFYMQNMTSYGGPLPDNWFEERVELGRKIHDRMQVYGISPALSGFSGMVPTDFAEKNTDATIVSQGKWCQFTRPSMLRVYVDEGSRDYFDELADVFYQAQKDVYGEITDYYAVDPFHEGGNTGDMDPKTIYTTVQNKMLEHDPDGIWVMQQWSGSISEAEMSGLQKEHALILDLASNARSYASRMEKYQIPWVWNMLHAYGGKLGMEANTDVISQTIPEAYEQYEYMTGIGMTAESLERCPMIYELLWEMAWTKDPVDPMQWGKDYMERRYGSVNDDLVEAWSILLTTVYNASGGDIAESLTNARPTEKFTSTSAWGSGNITYDVEELEKALKIYIDNYEQFKDSECYVYDMVDLSRQVLSNSSIEYHSLMMNAYNAGSIEKFEEYSDHFLALIQLQNDVLATSDYFQVGTWIEEARTMISDADDWTKDLFEFNARCLITTWAGYRSSNSGKLRDYSYRSWAGITEDYYLQRWEMWVENYKTALKNGTSPESITWFNTEWKWANRKSDEGYSYPTESTTEENLYELATAVYDSYSVANIDKIASEFSDSESYNLLKGEILETTNNLTEDELKSLTDEDTSTGWTGENSEWPAEFTYDFEGTVEAEEINFTLKPLVANGIPVTYKVEVYHNGIWKTLWEDVSGDISGQISITCSESIEKFRLTLDSEDTTEVPELKEVEVFGKYAESYNEDLYINVAKGIVCELSEVIDATAIPNLTDEETSTVCYVNKGNNEGTITVPFEEAQDIEYIELYFQKAGLRFKFDVYVTDANGTEELIYSKGATNEDMPVMYRIAVGKEIQSIRVHYLGRDTGGSYYKAAFGLAEIKAFTSKEAYVNAAKGIVCELSEVIDATAIPNLTDEDTSTRCFVNKGNSEGTITIPFEEVQDIEYIELYFEKAGLRFKFDVYVTDADGTEELIYSKGATNADMPVKYTFPVGKEIKSIRVHYLGRDTGGSYYAASFGLNEVFAYKRADSENNEPEYTNIADTSWAIVKNLDTGATSDASKIIDNDLDTHVAVEGVNYAFVPAVYTITLAEPSYVDYVNTYFEKAGLRFQFKVEAEKTDGTQITVLDMLDNTENMERNYTASVKDVVSKIIVTMQGRASGGSYYLAADRIYEVEIFGKSTGIAGDATVTSNTETDLSALTDYDYSTSVTFGEEDSKTVLFKFDMQIPVSFIKTYVDLNTLSEGLQYKISYKGEDGEWYEAVDNSQNTSRENTYSDEFEPVISTDEIRLEILNEGAVTVKEIEIYRKYYADELMAYVNMLVSHTNGMTFGSYAGDYDETAYEAFMSKVEELQNNCSSYNLQQVVVAEDELYQLFIELKCSYVSINRSELLNALLEAKVLVNLNYVEFLEKAIATAEVTYDTYKVTQAELDDATALLKTQIEAALAVLSAGEAADAKIAMAKSILENAVIGDKEGNYSQESAAALEEAIKAAEEVRKTASTEEALLEIVDKLETAVTIFGESVVTVNKQGLLDLIAQAEAIDLSECTERSGKALSEKITEAEALLENPVSQAEVDAMAKEIEEAVAALELKDADYTAVEAALAKVPEDLSIYTKGTAKAVTNAVAAVVEGLKITEQDEVDAMAKAIEDALAALELKSTLSGVIRVAGENRYETGFKVADVYKETLGVEKFQTALVATGKNFADALPGSYLAYVKQAPILLTSEKEEYMDSVVAYIAENVEAGAEIYILGGTAVVPAEVDEKLAAAGYYPVRLAGENRYETNVKILEAAGVTGGEIIVATGTNFADSLSASAVRKPILLVKDHLNDLQKEYLNTLKGSGFYIVGGDKAVGNDVEKELGAYGTVLDRLAGRNRRETSVLIAQKFFETPTAAVTAYAGNFPDGLCGGPLAAELNVPLLLTVDGNTTEAADYMAAKNIALGYVLGGEKVLADETVETVFGLESTDEIIVK